MSSSRLVYSTDKGRRCPKCQRPVAECICKKRSTRTGPDIKSDGTIRIRREVKGRKGKQVTTISGFQMDDMEIKALATKLKKYCGAGGTVKEGLITIQGDHREAVLGQIRKLGYPAKLAGG